MHANNGHEAMHTKYANAVRIKEEDHTLSRVSLAVCAAILAILAAATHASSARKPETKAAVQAPAEGPLTEAERKEIAALADRLVATLDEKAVGTILWNVLFSQKITGTECAKIAEKNMNPAFTLAAKNVAKFVVHKPERTSLLAREVEQKLSACADFRKGIAALMPEQFPHAHWNSTAFLTQLENK